MTLDQLRALCDGPLSFQVTGRSRVRVSGSDAGRYLNGQFSQDIEKCSETQAVYGLLLTAKGKLCADAFIWRDGTDFIVETAEELEDELLARLDRYIVADDVDLKLEQSLQTPWHVTSTPETGILIDRLGSDGTDLQEKPANTKEIDGETVELDRITRGIPNWGYELGPDVLPHEAGLDLRAFDFHKGCYVGQEVVSRIQSVGRTNRKLVGLSCAGSLAVGADVLAADGSVAGTITSSAQLEDVTLALAFLSTRCDDADLTLAESAISCRLYDFPLV